MLLSFTPRSTDLRPLPVPLPPFLVGSRDEPQLLKYPPVSLLEFLTLIGPLKFFAMNLYYETNCTYSAAASQFPDTPRAYWPLARSAP